MRRTCLLTLCALAVAALAGCSGNSDKQAAHDSQVISSGDSLGHTMFTYSPEAKTLAAHAASLE